MNFSPFHFRTVLLPWLALFVAITPLRSEIPSSQSHAQPVAPSVLSSSDQEITQPSNQFIRFVEDDSGAWLQCAMATYRHQQSGVSVSLIGAVHVADEAYYTELNQIFKKHDVVLYEMVGGPIRQRKATAPDDVHSSKPSAVPNASHPDSPESEQEKTASQRLAWLGPLHQRIQKALELQGQLEGIDYYAPNLVHADMTHAQFASKQKERNESFLGLWLKSIQVQIENPQITASQPGLLRILEILTRQDSATELKRIIARTFDSVESLIAGMESGDGTVILSERNKVALDVLEQQIALGKINPAIFYGAAHLPDLEKRLIDMGYRKINTHWLNAWSLPPEPVFESEKSQTLQNKTTP